MVYITENIASSASCKTSPGAWRPARKGTGTTKEALLKAVRAMMVKYGGRISWRKFITESGMRECDVLRYHSGWNGVLAEAGCTDVARNRRVDPEWLLADWGGVVRKIRRIPTWKEYRLHGQYALSTFVAHFKAWSRLEREFRKFAEKKADWKDVMELLPPSVSAAKKLRESVRAQARLWSGKGAMRLPGRPVRGDRLGIDGMARAPVNEQGVVFLFGLLAVQLGFEVESMQSSFPDCEATRKLATGAWQTLRVEFEYESRNFRTHRHNPEKCDLIVCWVHNWSDCPKNIEVIELSAVVKRLGPLVPA